MRHEKYNRYEYNEDMKRKMRNYISEFKSNVILELLSGQNNLNIPQMSIFTANSFRRIEIYNAPMK